MTGLWQDVRHALRSLAADPTYFIGASLILALGIGVNVAVVGAARTAFFPSLPFSQVKSLVSVYEQAPAEGISKFKIPYVNYLLVREQKKVFSGVALYLSPRAGLPFDLTGPGEPQKLAGAVVSSNFFDVLGVKPVLGRTFAESGDSDEPEPEAVIGYRLWQKLFGGSRSALGRTLTLNKRVYEVIGVMPPGFSFPKDTELWLAGSSPSTVNTIMNSNSAWVEFLPQAVARLQPGITPIQAETLLRTPLAHLKEGHLPGWPHVSLKLVPLYDDLYGDARGPLLILTVAAAFVLLIAWLVVAILCWVRAVRREKEIAVRAVLGAGKWQAMRQFATENGLVSLAGVAAAVFVGEWTTRLIPALIPSYGLPAHSGLADWHVLFYLAVVGALSAMVPGIWSARSAARIDLARALQEGSYSSTVGRGHSRVLSTLVGILVGVAFVLTTAAGLTIDNFRRITSAPLGWNPANVWMSSFNLHGPETSPHRIAALLDSAVTETEQLQGISAAAVADVAPIPSSSMDSITVDKVEGSSRSLPLKGLTFEAVAISPDYFKVLDIPLLQGRWFTDTDCVNSATVAIVDQSFARYFWGQSSPIGRRMTASRMADGRVATIIGVVGSTRASGHLSEPAPTIYTPIPARLAIPVDWLLVKMRGTTAPPIREIRGAFNSMGSGIVPSDPGAAAQFLAQEGALPRARAAILSLFGILALALAATGSYAVTAYAARQRVREFGIRMALGATRGGIVRLLLSQMLRSLAIGLVIGWIVVVSVTPVFRSLLYRAQTADLSLFVIVSAVLGCTVLVASLVSAWPVATLDPIVTLRHE